MVGNGKGTRKAPTNATMVDKGTKAHSAIFHPFACVNVVLEVLSTSKASVVHDVNMVQCLRKMV